MNTEHQDVLTRYLLGRLSEDARAKLEEQYSEDNDLFEELVEVENSLIDCYVRGQLSSSDRVEFENRFLSVPERRERIEFARTLVTELDKAEALMPSGSGRGAPTRSRADTFVRRIALAAAFLIVAGGGLWFTAQNTRLRQEVLQLNNSQAKLGRQLQESQQRIDELESKVQSETVPPELVLPGAPGESVVVLRLSSGLARGGGKPNLLPLSRGIAKAVLVLEMDGDSYSSYRASLETPEGQTLLTKEVSNGVTARNSRQVAVELPAAILKRGDYVLRLIGTNLKGQVHEVNAYSFRVAIRQDP